MNKKFKVLIAATLCSCSLSMVSFAGTWQAEGTNWKYQNDDSSYAANGWVADNGKWYYFDASGYMKTGWVEDNHNWYYLNPAGEMRLEPLFENQVTYYFDAASGVCTNPNAAQTVVSGTYTQEEQQYIDYREQFIVHLEQVTESSEKELNQLNKEDIEQGKALLNEMKVPFTQFYQIQAPARFAQAHEQYKSGCVYMIQFLDTCIEIIDSDNMDIIQYWDLYNKMNSLSQSVEDVFDLGDTLFNAAR